MGIIIRTNPWLREDSFRDFTRGEPGPKMTMDGVVGKTLLLLALLFVGAWLGSLFPHAALNARAVHPVTPWPLYHVLHVSLWPGLLTVILSIIGFIVWHFECLQVGWALGFALVEGMCLSSWTLATNPQCPGLGLMAATATVVFLALVLVAYWLGLVSDLSAWALGFAAVFITAAVGMGVILVVRGLGQDIAITGHAMIVYWAIVVGIMVYYAQHLALSFRYIQDAAEMEAPQWMEWRAAYGLMVSLVWIYVVLLSVLRQIRSVTRRSDAATA